MTQLRTFNPIVSNTKNTVPNFSVRARTPPFARTLLRTLNVGGTAKVLVTHKPGDCKLGHNTKKVVKIDDTPWVNNSGYFWLPPTNVKLKNELV